MAKTQNHYTARQRKKFSLRSAKAKLRFSNFLIGILCVVALVFLYIQPFFSVQVSYAVPAETLQKILQDQMGTTDISAEDLEDVDLTLGFSMTMEGKGLSGLLADELGTLIQIGNKGAEDDKTSSDSSGASSGTQDSVGSDGNETASLLSARTGGADGADGADNSSEGSSEEPPATSSVGENAEENNSLLNSLLQTCKENELVQSTISASVDELLSQAQAAVPRVVAIYVKVVVSEQAKQSSDSGAGEDNVSTDSGSQGQTDGEEALPDTDPSVAASMTAHRPYAKYLSGGAAVATSSSSQGTTAFGNLDVDELTKKIEELLSKDSVTVEEAQKSVMEYVKENQDALGLTDDSLAEVETQVSTALNNMAEQFGEPVTDENGQPVVDENGEPVMAIRPNEVFTDILVQAGMVDKEKVDEGAELSELLTEYIMTQIGETQDTLYYVFMAFSLLLAVLYVLWGFLLIKSIVKTCTGTPMGAFFVKLLTGLPFLLLVLVPTIGLSVLGMEGIINLLASAGAGSEITSQLAGLTLGVSGGWVAFACTVVLFVFGFLYSSFKREYRHAEKDLS